MLVLTDDGAGLLVSGAEVWSAGIGELPLTQMQTGACGGGRSDVRMPEDTTRRVALSIGGFALGFFTVKFSTFRCWPSAIVRVPL
jgi:hypothetical protein